MHCYFIGINNYFLLQNETDNPIEVLTIANESKEQEVILNKLEKVKKFHKNGKIKLKGQYNYKSSTEVLEVEGNLKLRWFLLGDRKGSPYHNG